MHSRSIEYIASDPKLAILIPGDKMKRSAIHVRIRRIDANRIVSFHSTLPVRRFVSVPPTVPQKDTPRIEIVLDLF
jgi:hypothetical protein